MEERSWEEEEEELGGGGGPEPGGGAEQLGAGAGAHHPTFSTYHILLVPLSRIQNETCRSSEMNSGLLRKHES